MKASNEVIGTGDSVQTSGIGPKKNTDKKNKRRQTQIAKLEDSNLSHTYGSVNGVAFLPRSPARNGNRMIPVKSYGGGRYLVGGCGYCSQCLDVAISKTS